MHLLVVQTHLLFWSDHLFCPSFTIICNISSPHVNSLQSYILEFLSKQNVVYCYSRVFYLQDTVS